MKCFPLRGDRWVEHARAPAACAPAAAAVASPPLRLRAGDGLPGEGMVPSAVVSLQSPSYRHKLYTTS